MDVSIVIVSWRVRDLLNDCLASIFRETNNLTFEVFVVDNNSNDGTVELVKKKWPQVQLMVNDRNYGFAHACNQAIKKSTGRYVLILNPDCLVTNNAIGTTYSYMAGTPDAGITGCRIVNTDGTLQTSVRRFPDLISHIIILLKLHNFFPNLSPIKKYYMSDWPHDTTGRVDQVMGAFYMIRRKTLRQTGLFDEHFYIWYEEVDLCRRALKHGWFTYFFADAQVVHHKGQSFGQRNPVILQNIFARSLLYYFYKHSSALNYLILLIFYPISLLLSIIVWLAGIKKKNKNL